MRIQPKYLSEQNTPMAYYKFLTRFSLFVGMLLNLVRFFNSINAFLNDHFWGDATDAVTLLFAFILCIVSLILLNQMDWMGVVALLSISVIEIIYCTALFGFMLINDAGWEGGSLIGTAIGYGAIFIINWVYFSKRRLLFTPSPKWVAIPTERYEAQESEMRNFVVDASTGEVIPNKVGTSISAPETGKSTVRVRKIHSKVSATKSTVSTPTAATKRTIKIIPFIIAALLVLSVGLNVWTLWTTASLKTKSEELLGQLESSLSQVNAQKRIIAEQQSRINDLQSSRRFDIYNIEDRLDNLRRSSVTITKIK